MFIPKTITNLNPVFLLLLLITSGIESMASTLNRDTMVVTSDSINWEADRPLTWEDFKAAQPHRGRNMAAQSVCRLGYDATAEDNMVLSLEIEVTFDPEKSWVQHDQKTDRVLEHEQLHFDIAELTGRAFHQAVLEHKQKGKLSLRQLQRLHEKFSNQHHQWQQLYDRQTNHGLNATMQLWWVNYIHSQLIQTEPFSDYHHIIIH